MLIAILMIMASVTEVVSIGAVIPFLGVLANPENVFQHKYLQQLITFMGITEPSQLMLLFTLAFAVAAVIAGFMRIVLLWGQIRLGNVIGADISYQIYKRTLYQPYSIHVARNSSEIIAGISIKTDQVVYQIILPVLYMIAASYMLSMILIVFIAIQPVMALSAIIGFSTIYGFFILLTRQRLLRHSRIISKKTNLIFNFVQEGLGGIRDVLIDGTQSTFLKSYRSADLPRRRASANNKIIGQIPRYGVESVGMVLIVGIAYYMGNTEKTLLGTLPLLGVLALGAQRMLPMLQQIYRAWSDIRGARALLQDILVLLEQPLPEYEEETTLTHFRRSIKLKKISFRYREDTPWILTDINLKILKGTKIGFVGTTGSGKSTLLDIIMALLFTTKGSMEVDGVIITDRNHRGWQSFIAHIPQTIFLSDASIAENIAFGFPIDKIDFAMVKKSAKQAQIHNTIKTWEKQYDTIVGERGIRLSGGQRQRIGIARALYKQADVLILDEATSALDNATEKAVLDAINETHEEITILMVAHRLSTLQACDWIIELDNGKIKRQGTPDVIIGTSH